MLKLFFRGAACLLLLICLPVLAGGKDSSSSSYIVLNKADYARIVFTARVKITSLLNQLKAYRTLNADKQIAFIADQLADIPYLEEGAMGEGDWQAKHLTYAPGAIHISQYPVYRLDGFDCQTFIQLVMALFFSKDLSEFDKNLIMIAYGAAGNPSGERVRNYNRNHFTDGDFNPVNQRLGFIKDATKEGSLALYREKTSAVLTRQHFFLLQQNNRPSVQVLQTKNGPLMVKRLHTLYSSLPFPNFRRENITLTYLPKKVIALPQKEGNYLPNERLLNQIPTPAIVEIVRDVKRWKLKGRWVRDVIGSETAVSHTGVLYRQTYKQGEIIYQQIECAFNQQQKACSVKPVLCQKKNCQELMLVHATTSHPDGFFWYKQSNGTYACSAKLPRTPPLFSHCNRIERIPLFAYLTKQSYGHYLYMENPALLGIHIEQFSSKVSSENNAKSAKTAAFLHNGLLLQRQV